MGCTSSTPLVTSGSNMLKAASNVAADAAKTAEDAVEDVTQALGKTVDTAKENVGTAVTGIANELSNVIKEKTDEKKTNLMEKLHLNNGQEDERTNATDVEMKRNETDNLGIDNNDDDEDEDEDEGNDDVTKLLSRAPTPTVMQQDSDSLKTMVSEPEIEQALANRTDNSPPTPKPSISELERLSAELSDLKTDGNTNARGALQMVSKSTLDASELSIAEETTSEQKIQHRPNTTEWEKYADLLAKDQKFHPNEIALRRRLIGSHAMTGILGTTIEIGTTGTEAIEASTSTSVKSLTMTKKPSTSTPVKSLSRTQSKSSIHPPKYFRDFPRSTTAVNLRQNDEESGGSDRNNDSNSSPVPSNRYSGAKMIRKRVPRSLSTVNVKKMHRQLTSLIGFGSDRSSLSGSRAYGSSTSRNFDFNPNRMRVGSPKIRRRNNQMLMPLQFNDPLRPVNRLGHRKGSPIQFTPIKQRSGTGFGATISIPHVLSSATPSGIGLRSFNRIDSPSKKSETRSLSRSSRSSNNNSISIKSACTTPISRSPSKNSLSNIAVAVVSKNIPTMPDNQHVHYPLRTFSRSSSPMPCFNEDFRFAGESRTPIGPSRSPISNKNTSSFLSSPRTSPFTVRKSYTECEDKENQTTVFVADLSSVTENRHLLSPSPYKIRERCAVCFNKYIVK